MTQNPAQDYLANIYNYVCSGWLPYVLHCCQGQQLYPMDTWTVMFLTRLQQWAHVRACSGCAACCMRMLDGLMHTYKQHAFPCTSLWCCKDQLYFHDSYKTRPSVSVVTMCPATM